MPLIAGNKLHDLINDGVIDALHENVNASSIDVRLDDKILIEQSSDGITDLTKKESLRFREADISDGINIKYGQFFLASTMETLNLPDHISCEFKLRSSVARSGLQHMLAGWGDAGFRGKLTLEFHNATECHLLRIKSGMRIGQLVFFEHEPATENSYRIKGRYNGQDQVTASKGV